MDDAEPDTSAPEARHKALPHRDIDCQARSPAACPRGCDSAQGGEARPYRPGYQSTDATDRTPCPPLCRCSQ
jgi:hypothetical protein